MHKIIFALGFALFLSPVALIAEGAAEEYQADDEYEYDYDDSGEYDEYDGEEYDDWDYGDYDNGDYDDYEEDPVFEIIRSGSLDEIRAAMGEKVDSSGNTLLMTACASDREKAVLEYLLSVGSSIEAKNFAGETALMFACQNGTSAETVAFLLQRGASLASRDEDGRTVLMYAAGNEDLSVLSWLLKERLNDVKGSIGTVDEYRRTVLSYLCGNASADPALIKRLIALGSDVNAADSDGTSPLAFAVSSDLPLAAIQALLSSGAKATVRDEYGTTPLMYAASSNGDPEVTKLLLASGAKVNDLDDYGYSALMFVFYNENPDALYPVLRKAGADPSVRGNDAVTPLMLAAQYGRLEIAKALIADGAKVNAVDDLGKTALIYACENNGDDSLIAALLDAGADILPIDETGMSARDYAADNWNLEGSEQLDRLESPLTSL